MKHEVELELKTLLTKEDFDKLVNLYRPLTFIKQYNYYYVTDDLSHYGFRVRIKESEQLFTLKQHIDGQVVEHEKIFSGNLEDDPEITSILNSFNISKPYTLFGELVTERAMVIDEYGELCFDINHYNGITDYEIEYEVKSEHDHLARFKEILSKANIEYIPNKVSKYKRCYNSLRQKQAE